MAAVGRCKYSALHRDEEEPNPYATSSGKEVSFWAAIFGCDLYGEDTDFRSLIESNYKKWLPPVPETWQIKNPRVTVLSSGLLSLGVGAAISAEYSQVEVGQGMQTNLIPRDWDKERSPSFTAASTLWAKVGKRSRMTYALDPLIYLTWYRIPT